jgi:putative peptidoglycan lipid II flippase
LSRKHAEASTQDFAETLDWAFRLVCLIAIPASIALALIAEPLLVTLFQNENFPVSDVVGSAGSLRAYAFGLIAFMAIKVFSPGFYARQNTSTPVRIGIIAMAANMAMNIIFYLSGLAHVGLALATSLAAFLNAGLLLRGLRVEKVFFFQAGWLAFLVRIALANLAMAIFLINFSGAWEDWLLWTTFQQAQHLALLVLGGLSIYGLVLFIFGLRWRDIYR